MSRVASTVLLALLALGAHLFAQQAGVAPAGSSPQVPPVVPPPAPLAIVPVQPIRPPARPLPREEESAAVTRFSFIAYGDSRGGAPPGDGEVVHPLHSALADAILAKVQALEATPHPVRFVLHSGDAVLRGHDGRQWNVSFSPIVDRLTAAGLPFFFAAGNHDVGMRPAGTPQHTLGLHNLLTAMSQLMPPEGSPRRLAGTPTYGVGFGSVFVIAIDSNVASDRVQALWVADQLEQLDRRRFRHVVALFHHAPFSSGPHGFDEQEPETLAVREIYMPLFRQHHVRLIVAGHEHLYEHWIERYTDGGERHRIDAIVSGGGGAPVYGYRGEPDLQAYLAAGGAANVSLEHLVKPAMVRRDNPHHFVVVQVDGDRLSLEVNAIGEMPLTPYEGTARVELSDTSDSSR